MQVYHELKGSTRWSRAHGANGGRKVRAEVRALAECRPARQLQFQFRLRAKLNCPSVHRSPPSPLLSSVSRHVDRFMNPVSITVSQGPPLVSAQPVHVHKDHVMPCADEFMFVRE